MTTQSHIDRLPRESYAALRPYVPLMTPVEVELSENTNQWGAPPAAVEALKACDGSVLFNYPSQTHLAVASTAGGICRH